MIPFYDEFDDRWDENGFDEKTGIDLETEFRILFEDTQQKNKYIVHGYHQLWHGTYNGHNPRVYSSLRDAIIDSQDGFGICYTQVYEEKYGKLMFKTIHHDGTNKQEILQLTKLGEKMYNNNCTVEKLLNVDRATKNVRLAKRLGLKK